MIIDDILATLEALATLDEKEIAVQKAYRELLDGPNKESADET
jgi:hypothetical protein